ncbi:choline dehydrogenase [Fusarium oxysporum Fo47]|uniref:Choline dehydrogenase n=1 Tax=Fusarium oxysporum Fo47 TaxID=660027 RepID=W9JPU3_FUSOX|nr:choline dehydrogenase [Fusarium oxysporum Fo47]EWZ34092.1 choline dehydrogenase [Fusarium oxysporum Fo47]QKD57933.1 choline dehydrogenase [Fusarium oxysporum Fo47]
MRPTNILAAVSAVASVVGAVDLTGYEYVVVGSGAGGGPLAARLALAGHKTLLIDAGDDQGQSLNYTVPAYSARASEDEDIAWNFFVRHYADDKRQAQDYKTTYETPDGGEYTGLDPPKGSTIKGTLYPRTATIGGCTAHNALIALYPWKSDFEYIASLTGDTSWSADNMRKYFVRLEDNNYLLPGKPGHGYNGWLSTETAPLSIALQDPQLLSLITGGAFALGNLTDNIINVATLLAGDANADTDGRDAKGGFFQAPIHSKNGIRVGPREFILAVRDAKDSKGNKKYPLDVRMNCHVTKVVFDESEDPPRATGVEFLDGRGIYKASPLSRSAGAGKPGSATASREVIVAGGTYNSPQILKLSGIGPADELKKFNIPVISDLPGVGTNLQDHYEIVVQSRIPKNFSALHGCTFDGGPDDKCLDQWQKPLLGLTANKGTYTSSGLPVAMLYKSTAADRGDWDIFAFGGPVNFRGYFPNYSYNATAEHDIFSWAILKGQPRNHAGTVTLKSDDPLDVPEIVYNYFDTGDDGYEKDIQALAEAVDLTRDAFGRQIIPTKEVLPGASVSTKGEVEDYIKNTAWGHHASCTCPIGAVDDEMAVLDSKFRVRGVKGLRVVDASVYPRIPGTFTAVSTFIVAEKAADDILSGLSGLS